MWPFLFILALVPLFYYWQDSLLELFPALAHFFPEKSMGAQATYEGPDPGSISTAGEPNKWYTSESPEGYLSWVVSGDGVYRLAIGCHAREQAVLQVTSVGKVPVPAAAQLNYQYGRIDLADGLYSGGGLIGAVAQFGQLYLQDPDNTAVLAQFTVPEPESNLIARGLQANCSYF
ncbi:hypothetical protein [Comamonas thiooxydans]|uniref:hypothetical protein n=1 Tax=Comamonas thiooxydans TaxID=363952 RepID=UPI000B40D6CA|nr:hypothetical protein [Comamonas thiooxydans]